MYNATITFSQSCAEATGGFYSLNKVMLRRKDMKPRALYFIRRKCTMGNLDRGRRDTGISDRDGVATRIIKTKQMAYTHDR